MSQFINIRVGVADVYFNETLLGLTQGGGVFTYEPEWHEITDTDEFGKTPIDRVLIGEKASYKTNLAELSISKMGIAIPTGLISGGKLTVGSRPGLKATSVAGELRVHPLSMGENTSADIIIYLASCLANFEMAFQLDATTVIPCEFTAYPDTTRDEGDMLFRIGK